MAGPRSSQTSLAHARYPRSGPVPLWVVAMKRTANRPPTASPSNISPSSRPRLCANLCTHVVTRARSTACSAAWTRCQLTRLHVSKFLRSRTRIRCTRYELERCIVGHRDRTGIAYAEGPYGRGHIIGVFTEWRDSCVGLKRFNREVVGCCDGKRNTHTPAKIPAPHANTRFAALVTSCFPSTSAKNASMPPACAPRCTPAIPATSNRKTPLG